MAQRIKDETKRMAGEIVELNNGTDRLMLVGIQRRGVQLADRLAHLIGEREEKDQQFQPIMFTAGGQEDGFVAQAQQRQGDDRQSEPDPVAGGNDAALVMRRIA